MRVRSFLGAACAVAGMGVVAPAGAMADGTISGTVTEGGNPVGSFEVEAYLVGAAAPTQTACTAGNGTYSISVPAGNYEVRFSGDAGPCGVQSTFAPEWWQNPNGNSRRVNADPVTVVEAANTPGINGTLVDGGSVSGTVLAAASNAPVQNVTVELLDVDSSVLRSTCSALNGTYRLDPIPSGVFTLRFSPNGTCGNAGNFATQWYLDAPTQAEADAIFNGGSEDLVNHDAHLVPPPAGGGDPGGGGGGDAGGGAGGGDSGGGGGGGTTVAPPDTRIDDARIRARRGTATFEFSGTGGRAPVSFECALTRGSQAPSFKSCAESKSYRRLRWGRYTFAVRAKDASGQTDATPAQSTFRSRRSNG